MSSDGRVGGVRIFGWKNGWGLSADSEVLGRMLENWRAPPLRVEHCDPLTWMPPRDATGAVANIHIYMEHPCRMAMPWATYNVLVVNPEWFYVGEWDWCAAAPAGAGGAGGGIDLFVFKEEGAAALFRARYPDAASRAVVLPWRSATVAGLETVTAWSAKERRFLYLIGGSVNKAAAAERIVAAWRPEWPPLEIWCAAGIADKQLRRRVLPGATVEFQTEYRPVAERVARQQACAWHVVASEAEGFGYTMAEAAACGVPVLWTDLPVYRWTWGEALGSTGRISMVPAPGGEPRLETSRRIESREAIQMAVTSLLAMGPEDVRRLQERLQERRGWTLREFRAGWERVLRRAAREAHGSGVPTAALRVRAGEELPIVGVVTVTRNRRAWWPNMVENVQRQRWPVARLVWIIVDDGDEGQTLAEEAAMLQERVPALTVGYVRVDRVASLGAKREAGVVAAREAGCEYALMMDDDDHYPETSVPERMRWLLRAPGVDAVTCATIPMYDVTRYISAMNVPPLNLSPGKRVSEATVAFRIAAVPAGKSVFADVDMAEGEDLFGAFPVGTTREIPPMGIIVSFIHTANSSSRRVPAETEANGCHYGFSDEYFRYVHAIGANA